MGIVFVAAFAARVAIVQAPMAGAQGSALAIALSNAGGLGALKFPDLLIENWNELETRNPKLETAKAQPLFSAKLQEGSAYPRPRLPNTPFSPDTVDTEDASADFASLLDLVPETHETELVADVIPFALKLAAVYLTFAHQLRQSVSQLDLAAFSRRQVFQNRKNFWGLGSGFLSFCQLFEGSRFAGARDFRQTYPPQANMPLARSAREPGSETRVWE